MNAHFGYNADRPFLGGWYYVEFFFIITGFFTMRRFFHEDVVGGTERVRTALTYTFRKFVKFLPYTTVAILITYVANNWKYLQAGQPGNFLHSLENMPAEMLYLSAANPDGSEMFTIWFLSAMSLVFPLFCLLLMMKNKPLAGWICFATATFYYLHTYDSGYVLQAVLVAREAQYAAICVACCGCERDIRWIHRIVNDETGAYFLGRILRGSTCEYGHPGVGAPEVMPEQ